MIKQCNDLDNVLVRLSEPENFRAKAVLYLISDWRKGEALIRYKLFPEMTRRGKMEVVCPGSPDWKRLMMGDRQFQVSIYDEFENGIEVL